MRNEDPKQKALTFRELHHGPKILLLPNVWDVVSARIIEEAGYPALATTSAGIAFSLGYPDGEKIPKEEMFARIARICRAVRVPVTADVEAGYGNRPEDAAATATAVIEAGAVGINLEDGSGDPANPLVNLSLQLEKIKAMREAAVKTGVLLVVNARTDVYLRAVGSTEEERYRLALERVLAFRDAGADCVFVPGLRDRAVIEKLVNEVKCPVNILAQAGYPSIPELEKLGVARVSLGSGPMRVSVSLLKRLADELKGSGTYSLLEGAIPGTELNKLMGR
ncbi:MAG TPA: isocitrate lyase/phosphoenolpyruvate mutase family protein [Terriglobales bacterium]|nr:isocitrate lyase/phosphoenolpyruvate mutase family protein [Terriglobales bacterium]